MARVSARSSRTILASAPNATPISAEDLELMRPGPQVQAVAGFADSKIAGCCSDGEECIEEKNAPAGEPLPPHPSPRRCSFALLLTRSRAHHRTIHDSPRSGRCRVRCGVLPFVVDGDARLRSEIIDPSQAVAEGRNHGFVGTESTAMPGVSASDARDRTKRPHAQSAATMSAERKNCGSRRPARLLVRGRCSVRWPSNYRQSHRKRRSG